MIDASILDGLQIDDAPPAAQRGRAKGTKSAHTPAPPTLPAAAPDLMPVATSDRRGSPLAHVKEPGGGFTRKGVDGPPLVTDPNGATITRGRNKGEPRLVEYAPAERFVDLIVDTHHTEAAACRAVVYGLGLDPDLVDAARKWVATGDMSNGKQKWVGNELVGRIRAVADTARQRLRADVVYNQERVATLQRRDYLYRVMVAVAAGAEVEQESELVSRYNLDVAEPSPLIVYDRASKLSEGISNKAAIHRWDWRKIVEGIVSDDNLLADCRQAAADTRIDEPEWEAFVDDICARARHHAQSHKASSQGTHAHALSEDFDLDGDWLARARDGVDLGVGVDAATRLVAAWDNMCDQYGFESIVVEARVVNDHYRIAGSADRYVRCTRDITFPMHDGRTITIKAGTVLVGDIKSGSMTLNRDGYPAYWNPYSVQFAGYAGAVPYDTETGARGEWSVTVDQDWALLFHLDVAAALEGETSCTPYLVDLSEGAAAAELVLAAQRFAESNRIISLAPIAETSGWGTTAALTANVDRETDTLFDADTVASAHDRNAVRARLNSLQARGPSYSQLIRTEWPVGVPVGFNDHEHTVSEVKLLHLMCDGIEETATGNNDGPQPRRRRHDPVGVPVDAPTQTGTHSVNVVDEGDNIDDNQAETVGRAFAALPATGAAWMKQLIVEAGNNGLSFRFREHGDPAGTNRYTVRRFEIARGLIALAGNGWCDDDFTPAETLADNAQFEIVRTLVAAVLGAAVDTATPAGVLVGNLSASQAAQFAQSSTALVDDTAQIVYHPVSGHPQIIPIGE